MEIWKEVQGFDGYEISNLGRVKSNKTNKILKLQNMNGYKSVWMNYKTPKVHRLVAMMFIPNPDNLLVVEHLDDDKTNNKVENLKWSTQQENLKSCRNKGRWNNQHTKLKV